VPGRHYHFEYRILSKEKINGTIETVQNKWLNNPMEG